MAIAAIPAAVWWGLGSAAAGGVAAKATGHDWKKGAALGGLGGLGLGSLLAGGAAAGAGAGAGASAAATGSAAAAPTLATTVGMGGAAPGAAAAGNAAGWGSALKSGAVSAGSGLAMQSMQPDITSENPQPFALRPEDPNAVFQIMQQLERRKSGMMV